MIFFSTFLKISNDLFDSPHSARFHIGGMSRCVCVDRETCLYSCRRVGLVGYCVAECGQAWEAPFKLRPLPPDMHNHTVLYTHVDASSRSISKMAPLCLCNCSPAVVPSLFKNSFSSSAIVLESATAASWLLTGTKEVAPHEHVYSVYCLKTARCCRVDCLAPALGRYESRFVKHVTDDTCFVFSLLLQSGSSTGLVLKRRIRSR